MNAAGARELAGPGAGVVELEGGMVLPGMIETHRHPPEHISRVNSAALACISITRDTLDPEGGRIERDPVTGEPWGAPEGGGQLGHRGQRAEPGAEGRSRAAGAGTDRSPGPGRGGPRRPGRNRRPPSAAFPRKRGALRGRLPGPHLPATVHRARAQLFPAAGVAFDNLGDARLLLKADQDLNGRRRWPRSGYSSAIEREPASAGSASWP